MKSSSGNKIIVAVCLVLLIFGASVAGVTYTYYKSRQTNNLEMAMAEFTAGYNDGTITDLSDFIVYCSPDNVEVFNWINFQNQPQGILFRCLKDNSTIPLKYSDRYNKQYKELT